MSSESGDMLGPMAVLLVEDDISLGTLYAKAYREQGYEVSKAETREEARAAIAAKAFDLVHLDLCLPVTEGHEMPVTTSAETIRLIREIRPKAQIAVVSGLTLSTIEGTVEASMPDRIFLKPVALVELMSYAKSVDLARRASLN